MLFYTTKLKVGIFKNACFSIYVKPFVCMQTAFFFLENFLQGEDNEKQLPAIHV